MQLGYLEKLVLQYFWDTDEADAKRVHRELTDDSVRTLNTIQSTLDRLYKKKLLIRNKAGHAFIYRAAMAKNAFLAQLMREVAADYTDNEDTLLAAFSSLSAEMTETQLQALASLIDQRRASDKSGK
ncbi:CopY family transcriptional repressor [gamma proteobacterium BDW918]|jgi:predicted transcriptional regulator|uniref:TrmB family transcriptional regulator n=2 Tax=Zhongshania TaxID=1434050 RepID=A0A127M5B1_9GAMM|nr:MULTISPECIES: BlaI/MecI/CopY family transcriptional regulator [Zhongshania]AMO68419.1 TrmB family transcriptional regulator [Zhongshania aliphaticivorans]EIF43021.1 CopY family transcriptional repressor [gamma proteobacterium BDW918]MBQ0797547.1 BlaI/MecI/CopY family transcriptional regulator [Zhongshania sp.]|tara:strand:- start:2571 stop:2951 length:381 start_codon:yes stop_codon:yes gene_type:complete